MPEIIDHDLLVRSGLLRASARWLTSSWVEAGLLEPAGPRAGIFYNLVRDPHGRSAHLGDLLVREYATPILIGASSLHHHGWTTQMAHHLEVAVPVTRNRRRFLQLDGAIVVPRSLTWFRKIADHYTSDGPFGLNVLDPEYALADSYRHCDVWRPDPDDVDISGAADDHVRGLLAALEEIGVEEAAREALIEELEIESFGFSPKP